MKKRFVLVLCLVMVLCLLAACGGGGTTTDQPTTPEGKTVITIGLPVNMKVKNYETNAFTLWLEETTGYDLQFKTFAATTADYQSQIATRLDDLPDILWNVTLAKNTIRTYAEDGYILDLTEYYEDEELSKPFWDQVATLPEDYQAQIKNALKDRETGMAMFVPTAQMSKYDTIDYFAFINKDWLKALNLKSPTNADELYTVLVAFRDQDPNGNNQKDEIPIMGFEKAYCGDVINWIVNMFIYADDNVWWNVDENGKLYSPYTTDAYREALKFIKKLNDEGLLPGETTYTGSHSNIKKYLSAADTANDVGIWLGHPVSTLENGCDALYSYEAMNVWGCAVDKPQSYKEWTFITDSCENPRAAFEVLMAMASHEGSLRMRYGQKDVDWKYVEGSTTKIERISGDEVFTGMTNQTWGVICGTIMNYTINEETGHNTSEWETYRDQMQYAYEENFHAAGKQNNPAALCPEIEYTTDEAAATDSIRSNIQAYIKQCRSHFGSSLMDPNKDSDWQAYLNELQKMGLQTWRDQCQNIYETMK